MLLGDARQPRRRRPDHHTPPSAVIDACRRRWPWSASAVAPVLRVDISWPVRATPVTFRSVFGDVAVRVPRLLVCPCQGQSEVKSFGVLDFGHDAVAPDTETFLQAAQARMTFARMQCSVSVDQTVWVLGFAQGTPYRLDAWSSDPSAPSLAIHLM
jgi:hypothetical protein